MEALKILIWAVWAVFLAYSLYCVWRENFFKSVKQIASLHWGRQVGIDLYLGLGLFLLFVCVIEGSWLPVALWAVAAILFGNLATLFYVALHFDAIAARLMP